MWDGGGAGLGMLELPGGCGAALSCWGRVRVVVDGGRSLLPPRGRDLALEGVWEGAWGGIQTLPCVCSVPHLSSPPPVPNRTQNCTGGSLPPPKIGHLNSKLFLNEIAKKEKQLRKLLEGG